MQLSKIFAKLMSIDSQMHDLQSGKETAPTTTEDRARPQDDTARPTRSITDQKLLTLYKALDMGA